MNISYNWLRSLAPTITASPDELADRFAMLGAPVDEITDLAAGIGDIVVARVTEVRPHPNADRLRLCAVDAGGDRVLQVVCGAPNVEAGKFYPFAPVGSELPGGVAIRKAKLRGEVSEGMLCSARELGLGRDHAGLMTLHGEWDAGASLVDAIGLDDVRLVVDVTANRPDLLSHLGVARELAPGGVADLRLPAFGDGETGLELRSADREGSSDGVRVRIEDAAACPRYTAAVIRGVGIGPSPEWLASRLRAIGVRPINNVVDATNYVLHELGQPLHAFDLNRLAGPEIRVRRAAPGERIRTLDGVDRALDGEMLVIADAERPVAVAGVMGGEESEVGMETTELLLECARFDPRTVRRTRRALGLSTDASYRFERGVDPELQPRALRRLVELVVAVAGGQVSEPAIDVRPAEPTETVIPLRLDRAERLLGVRLFGSEIAALLEPLGFRVAEGDDALRVAVPSFRPDVTREVDLLEEIARRRGYDSFPEQLRPFRPSSVPEDSGLAVQRRARTVLHRWGLIEARTAAFAPAAEHRVPLLNPLSAEESHLRDSLVPGLIRRVEHNWVHGTRDVRLYDIGTVFLPGDGGGTPREQIRLAAALTGARRPPHWSADAERFDVWDLKGLLEELADELGLGLVGAGDAAAVVPFTHEGERLIVGSSEEEAAGGGGRTADRIVDAPAWAGPLWVLEITLPERLPAAATTFRSLPEYPATERDLALLVPAGVAAAEVSAVLEGAAGELLEWSAPFDVYTGEGVPNGMRSIAWRLRFRRADRTLTDAEADNAQGEVLRTLEERLGVRRR